MAKLESPRQKSVVSKSKSDSGASTSHDYCHNNIHPPHNVSFAGSIPCIGGVQRKHELLQEGSIPETSVSIEKCAHKYQIFSSKNLNKAEVSKVGNDAIEKVQKWIDEYSFHSNEETNTNVNEVCNSIHSIPDFCSENKVIVINKKKRKYCIKVGTRDFNTASLKTAGILSELKLIEDIKYFFLHELHIKCPLEISPLKTYSNFHVLYVYCQLNKAKMAWKLVFSTLHKPSSIMTITSTNRNYACPHIDNDEPKDASSNHDSDDNDVPLVMRHNKLSEDMISDEKRTK